MIISAFRAIEKIEGPQVWDLVDTDTLDMTSLSDCVLGQIYGRPPHSMSGYNVGLDVLARHGYHRGLIDFSGGRAWWVFLIRRAQRRNKFLTSTKTAAWKEMCARAKHRTPNPHPHRFASGFDATPAWVTAAETHANTATSAESRKELVNA